MCVARGFQLSTRDFTELAETRLRYTLNPECVERDWYFIAEQLAPELHLTRPVGRAALRICDNYCAPCQPLLRAFSGECVEMRVLKGVAALPCVLHVAFNSQPGTSRSSQRPAFGTP